MDANKEQSKRHYFTLGEAAKEVGVAKSTISKALKNGKLSIFGKEGTSYQIDAAELFRVFPKIEQVSSFHERLETHNEHHKNTNNFNGLELELNLAHERLKDKDEIIDGLKEERDDWKKQAQTLLLQTPHQKLPEMPAEEQELTPRTFYPKSQGMLSMVLICLFTGIVLSFVLHL